MGKIHTHYDNLKVARMAPQEVIRAAYKALSQKYHPDKNPGDEKAARIMAILNSAYGTLSDAQRRKEHDEWIAAEEWEIEWLESTRNEDSRESRDGRDGRDNRDSRQRHDAPPQAWAASDASEPSMPRGRPRRNWLWWSGMGLCLVLGWAGGMLMVAQPQLVSAVLVSAWGGKGELASSAHAAPRPDGLLEARSTPDIVSDGCAVSKASAADSGSASRPAPIKVLTLSQVLLPPATPDCDSDGQPLVSPNGEPWPQQSGYVDGFPVANHGNEMQLMLDNAGNASPVFIKIYDMDRHANVRYVYLQARDKMVVDQLANGKYEIRYQNIDPGADLAACPARRKNAATASN